jgi:hypothetical protein
MLKRMQKLHIQRPRDLWVENCKPILLDLLLVGGKSLQIQLRERVAYVADARAAELARAGYGAETLVMLGLGRLLGLRRLALLAAELRGCWTGWAAGGAWAGAGVGPCALSAWGGGWWGAGVAVLLGWHAVLLAAWREWDLGWWWRATLQAWRWLWHLMLSWWTLALCWGWLWWETWAGLAAAGHYAAKEIRWAVADGWWWCLGWTTMWWAANAGCGWTTASLEFAT